MYINEDTATLPSEMGRALSHAPTHSQLATSATSLSFKIMQQSIIMNLYLKCPRLELWQ